MRALSERDRNGSGQVNKSGKARGWAARAWQTNVQTWEAVGSHTCEGDV